MRRMIFPLLAWLFCACIWTYVVFVDVRQAPGATALYALFTAISWGICAAIATRMISHARH
jgi:hypothetical protein